MQQESEKLEFVQGVNFEFIDSLKNNCRNFLLFFDNSCEEICISKAFIDFATAGSYRGSSRIDTKHYVFHQSILARDGEHQKTHIVFFKSPIVVMPVSTLSAPSILGSQLVDWYRQATSVAYSCFLCNLSPCVDNRLSYCTN